MNEKKTKKVNILGVDINRINMSDALHICQQIVDTNQKVFITVPNVFVVTECNKDVYYKKVIQSSDIALPDGLPLVWSSYFLGQYTGGRVAGPDFFTEFHGVAEKKGYTCYYLGGGPGGSEKVVENLKRKHPALKIKGNFSPPFGEIPDDLNNKILKDINTAKPHILWVGMGAPRQEKWIYRNLEKLQVNIAIGVGAVFDYEAGKTKRAPLWMQKIGMEWSYRILYQDTTLLWKKRYYAYLWEFILPVLLQVVKERVLKKRG